MMVAEHKVHIYNPNLKSKKRNSLNSEQMKFSRKISHNEAKSLFAIEISFVNESREGGKFLFSLQRPFTARMEVYDGERSAAAVPKLQPN